MMYSISNRSLVSRFGLSPWAKSSHRKSDSVYHYLEERIICGLLTSGTAIAEQQVAEACDCAQGTVREAMLRLQQSGLVERHDYRGTHVAEICLEEAIEIVKIRAQLESRAARMTASKISPKTRDHLFEILDAMCRAADENETFICSAFDRMFHATLFRKAKLPGLEPILQRCALLMHRVTLSHRNVPLNAEDIYSQHIGLIEAHFSGSPDEAAQAAKDHVNFLLDTWILKHTHENLKSCLERT